MNYQNNSCLRSGEKDYSHKSLLNTESKAPGNVNNRGACGGMARPGAGHGPYADLASNGESSLNANNQPMITNEVRVANRHYKKRSCSRHYLKGCRAKRQLISTQQGASLWVG
jgi:hypothetical protein